MVRALLAALTLLATPCVNICPVPPAMSHITGRVDGPVQEGKFTMATATGPKSVAVGRDLPIDLSGLIEGMEVEVVGLHLGTTIIAYQLIVEGTTITLRKE